MFRVKFFRTGGVSVVFVVATVFVLYWNEFVKAFSFELLSPMEYLPKKKERERHSMVANIWRCY